MVNRYLQQKRVDYFKFILQKNRTIKNFTDIFIKNIKPNEIEKLMGIHHIQIQLEIKLYSQIS